jgi:PhnB protein
MELNTQIALNGQCEAAFKYYEKCLGAKIAFMLTYADSPMAEQTPAGWREKICHARITLDGAELTGADVNASAEQYQKPQGFSLQLNIADPAEAERVFQTLAENGTVQMPLQKTFWAERFGVLIDQFGVPWDINCEKPA